MPKLQIFILPLLILIVTITSLQNTKKLELNLQTKDIDSTSQTSTRKNVRKLVL